MLLPLVLPCAFGPTSGISLISGSLTLAGDTTVISAGLGTIARSAIGTTAGTVRIEPAVQLVPNGNAPPIGGPANVLVQRIPSVRATGVPVGQTLTARIHAEAGSLTFTFLSWPFVPVTLPFGTLWVDPNSVILDGGLVPGTGIRTVSVVVPPSPRAQPIVLQPISALASLPTLVIGTPTMVIVN